MNDFKIIKKQEDRLLGVKVLRASLGGNPAIGYYLTYRGTIKEIKKLLEIALKEIDTLKEEPEISPDEGKKYA